MHPEMVHALLPLAGAMFMAIGQLVNKPACMPEEPQFIKSLKLSDSDIFLSTRECGFIACCEDEVSSLETEDRRQIRTEMKKSVIEMLTYLQARVCH